MNGTRGEPGRVDAAPRVCPRRGMTSGRLVVAALLLAGTATLVAVAGTSTPGVALPGFVAAGRTPGATTTPTTRPGAPTTTTTSTVPTSRAVTRGTTTYITPVRQVHVEDDQGERTGSRDDGTPRTSPGND